MASTAALVFSLLALSLRFTAGILSRHTYVAVIYLCRCRKRRMFETLSFLPPLDDEAIAKQVEYIIKNNWTPCLEFSEPEFAYVKAVNTNHIRGTAFCNYMDNRYCLVARFKPSACGSRFSRPTSHICIARQVLDHVQAAHVRLQRRWPGAERDLKRHQILPRRIHQDYLLRPCPPSTDVLPVGAQATQRSRARRP